MKSGLSVPPVTIYIECWRYRLRVSADYQRSSTSQRSWIQAKCGVRTDIHHHLPISYRAVPHQTEGPWCRPNWCERRGRGGARGLICSHPCSTHKHINGRIFGRIELVKKSLVLIGILLLTQIHVSVILIVNCLKYHYKFTWFGPIALNKHSRGCMYLCLVIGQAFQTKLDVNYSYISLLDIWFTHSRRKTHLRTVFLKNGKRPIDEDLKNESFNS
jgi:hypothetical protein